MELRQLRYFVVLAQHLHFGRAARELQMAQPPLSQQIRKLESDLGAELFVRTSRHVELTENGQMLVPAAKAALAEAEHVRQLAEGLRHGEAGRLHVAFAASVLNWGLTSALREFREMHPAAQVVATQMTFADQVDALLEERVNVGFVFGDVIHDDITVTPLGIEPLVLVISDDDPRAQAGTVELRDFATTCSSRPTSLAATSRT